MPIEKISLLHLGKVDGKHEFTESGTKAQYFFDAFLIPESINVDDFLVGDRFIISGFRGTGKTSLLRYLAKQLNDGGGIGQIVLFKTGLSETQKIEISRLSQASLEELISEKIEIAQDFKDAWRWFFHKKIGELLKDKMEIARNNRLLQSYLELLGLNDTPWFEKIMGGFPKLEGTKVKIRGKMPFLEASVEGKIPSGDTGNSILFSEVVNKLDEMIARIGLSRLIYIYVDELEVFFHTQEQYRRDLRLVRDLLFAAEKMVQIDARAKIGLRVCVAVRSEVLDALGAEGQEVTRLAHDCGVNIAWHYAKRGLDHPLIEMVRKKVWASEKSAKIELSEDPIETYFPTSVKGIPLDAFLLDQSFYKPRDLVWRLTIAQRFSPAASKFDEQAFTQTDVDYSAKLWDEILYELSAVYSPAEISGIEGAFSGLGVYFNTQDLNERFKSRAAVNKAIASMIKRRPINLIAQDLYRLGAIGNAFRVGPRSRDVRNRWVFRGDSTLLLDKRMELHPALTKRLAAIRPKRRSKSSKHNAEGHE